MLIASRLHFTLLPPIAPTVSLHRPVYLPCIMACTLVFTHYPTPLAVFCRRRPLHAVQMVITWTAPAPLTGHIASGVTAEKNIARYRYYPIHANITQYPITQYRYRSNPNDYLPI